MKNLYEVWFEVVGNHNEIRSSHLDIIEGSGYSVAHGPYLERKKNKTVHLYFVERVS